MGVFGWLKKATKVVGKMAMDAAEEPSRYSPNPEWMGQMDLVDSRMNAQILAPQFLKQLRKVLRFFPLPQNRRCSLCGMIFVLAV